MALGKCAMGACLAVCFRSSGRAAAATYDSYTLLVLQGFELCLRTVFLDNKVVFTFAGAASIDPAAPAADRLHMLQSRLESEALARAQARPSCGY